MQFRCVPSVNQFLGAILTNFRPASLDLHHVPIDVHSSPDGSCFLIVNSDGASTSIITYHWSTFGSTNGVSLPIADWAGDSKLVISSLVRRSAVYLLKLDLLAHICSSVALDITRKVTKFMFREKDSCGALSRDANLTMHNCLMDCHADVWTRFPVLPAVQRATISSNDRCRRSILFVTDQDHNRYQPHFADMIETFERTTKKPTGDKLSALQVSAMTFDSFIANFSPDAEWNNTSIFKVGEWVVDILCLIPIHLALARDNRFVPLKDGVYSVEVEKSLLGAEINRIVDSISFGWYESIFQSYMADKVRTSPIYMTALWVNASLFRSLFGSCPPWESNPLGKASPSTTSSIHRLLDQQCGPLKAFGCQ